MSAHTLLIKPIMSHENHTPRDMCHTCVHTWPAFLLPTQCYLPQSSYWLFSPIPETQGNKRGKYQTRVKRKKKHELTYGKYNSSTIIKLSVSFRQVWHGAVWTLTTVSSERSTRAGSDDQDHHMILQ